MAGNGKADGTRARVPASAEAIVELLNSRPHATPSLPDTLDDPEVVRAILHAFGLPGEEPLAPGQLDLVRKLRSDLMEVLTASDGASVARGWQQLTAHAAEVAFRHEFAPEEARLRQATGDPLAGGVTAAVAELVRDGTWSRVRVCGNPDCSHVFYDTTRSRTQRWHSYEVCGNRSNVAAYRERQARRTTPDGPR